MSQNPYSYENRTGVRPISWEEFHSICKGLVVAISSFQPEIVLSIGRGGFYAGTLISHICQLEVYPVRVSRRVNDIPQYATPKWLVRPPRRVKGKRVLVVDEVCGSGETLLMVKGEAERLGASDVRLAVLCAHTWGVDVPDYIGLVTDDLVLNPWDREIYRDGIFQFHPEYEGALAKQGLQLDPSLLIDAPVVEVDKGWRARGTEANR